MHGDTIEGTVPSAHGRLRFVLQQPRSGTGIQHGFWLQDPDGGGWRYATPVSLTRATDGIWRGSIAPLASRWSVYLLVTRGTNGALRGVIRNPEANWHGGAAAFDIRRSGDTLRFYARDSLRFSAHVDRARDLLVLDTDPSVVLTRRARDEAVGFYSRAAGASTAYEAPRAIRGDGWRVARARDEGLDESRLAALTARIAAADPAAPDAALIHSVLVARHGRLVFEEYFHGFDAARTHDLRSASKTMTSVLLGAEQLRGVHVGPATRVAPLFPWGDSLVRADSRRGRITVGNLLTHTSGLACDDNDDDSPGGEDRMQSQTAQPDWYEYVFALPVVHEPGRVYAYCSGGTNLAAGAIGRAASGWLTALFDRDVARPLDIHHYAIQLTPTGDLYGGGGMYMRPRDLLKFGVLYLNGGLWRGRRIVPESWVAASTANQTSALTATDGYAWHRSTLEVNGRQFDEYEANGNGGQFLIVLPQLDISVVFTAGNYGQYFIWRHFRDELVPQFIIAAVREDSTATGRRTGLSINPTLDHRARKR